jgi:hypothetical protein
LQVSEAERLCYSRRKLHAISVLRQAGLDSSECGLHKGYRVPGMRGKVYLVQHPGSTIYAFSSLAEIERYAAALQTPNPWSLVPRVPEPKRVDCVWEGCRYYANRMIEGEPSCSGHAYIYAQIIRAQKQSAS